jgi:hypothetical protein
MAKRKAIKRKIVKKKVAKKTVKKKAVKRKAVKKKVVKRKAVRRAPAKKRKVVRAKPVRISVKPVKKDKTLSIVGLIVNLLVPGLGSIIGGKIHSGIWQLILLIAGPILGILFTATGIGAIIGIPLLLLSPIVAWIWALITGIMMVAE